MRVYEHTCLRASGGVWNPRGQSNLEIWRKSPYRLLGHIIMTHHCAATAPSVLIWLLFNFFPDGNAHINSLDLTRCDIEAIDYIVGQQDQRVNGHNTTSGSVLNSRRPLLLRLPSHDRAIDFDWLRQLTVGLRDSTKVVRQGGVFNSSGHQAVHELLEQRRVHFDMRRDSPIYIALTNQTLPAVPEELDLVQAQPTVSLGGAGSGIGFHHHSPACSNRRSL